MTEAGIYKPRHGSPTALTLVVLLHGAALAALVMAKMDMPVTEIFRPTEVDLIEIKPDPKEIPPEPIKEVKPRQIERIERIVPVPQPPESRPELTFARNDKPIESTPEPTFTKVEPQPEPKPEPRPDPVRRDAQIDPRSELKPPYPSNEQRMGVEGSVTVRVLIGPDGKVKSAQKVRATNDAFFQATLRHALRNWRFRPATVDGRPIESSKVMTLHFSLEGEG
jgi:protein TonB